MCNILKKNQIVQKKNKIKVNLAEWSKALDLRSSIFGCVGSNPTVDTDLFFNKSKCPSSSVGRAQAF